MLRRGGPNASIPGRNRGKETCSLRRFGLIALVIGAFAAFAPLASADVSGIVTTASGQPLSACVRADAPAALTSDTRRAGVYNLSSPLHARRRSRSPSATSQRSVPGLGAGATTRRSPPQHDLPRSAPGTHSAARRLNFGSGAAEPSGYVDPASGRVLSPIGGVTYLRLPIPYSATGLTVLYNGVAIGVSTGTTYSGYYAQITRPAGRLGPTALSSTACFAHLGTMVVIGAITAPPASSKGVDIEVVIDISGSMSGTDPQFLRKDAMRALLGLVGKNDRLGAVGFDDQFEPIFDLQSVTDANSGALANLADQHILDRGGTDYNVAFAKGYEAHARRLRPRAPQVRDLPDRRRAQRERLQQRPPADGREPDRPPVARLRGPARHAVPARDVARLKRIATETGGQYATATTNTPQRRLPPLPRPPRTRRRSSTRTSRSRPSARPRR